MLPASPSRSSRDAFTRFHAYALQPGVLCSLLDDMHDSFLEILEAEATAPWTMIWPHTLFWPPKSEAQGFETCAAPQVGGVEWFCKEQRGMQALHAPEWRDPEKTVLSLRNLEVRPLVLYGPSRRLRGPASPAGPSSWLLCLPPRARGVPALPCGHQPEYLPRSITLDLSLAVGRCAGMRSGCRPSLPRCRSLACVGGPAASWSHPPAPISRWRTM